MCIDELSNLDARKPLSNVFDTLTNEQESLLDAGCRERLESPGEEGDVQEREEALRDVRGFVSSCDSMMPPALPDRPNKRGSAFHRGDERLTQGRCSPPTSSSSNSSSSVRFRLTRGPHRSSSPHPSQRTTAWNGCDVSSSFRAFDMVARRGKRLNRAG